MTEHLFSLLNDFSIHCSKTVATVQQPIQEQTIIRNIKNSNIFAFQKIQFNDYIKNGQTCTGNKWKGQQFDFEVNPDLQSQQLNIFPQHKQNKYSQQKYSHQDSQRTQRKQNQKDLIHNKIASRYNEQQNSKNKSYKPNSLLSGLFTKKYSDFYQFQNQEITEQQKQAFLETLVDLTVKENFDKEVKFKYVQRNNEQQKYSKYAVNNHLMAPQKRKMKVVKIQN